MRSIIKNIILFGLTFLYLPEVSYGQSKSNLFGTTEYKSAEISAFTKWTDLKTRHNKEERLRKGKFKPALKAPCRMTKNFKCVDDEWVEAIENLKNKSPKEKLDGVNYHINQTTYVTDMVNWRKKDYWATLNQFFKRNGDCEDYAIAKYYSLKELGFSPDQMRIVVVEDKNLNIAHAVLAVYINDKIWILDNQISKVILDKQIIHYHPLYSINEKAWWLHKKSS